jgi:hypothetical protein
MDGAVPQVEESESNQYIAPETPRHYSRSQVIVGLSSTLIGLAIFLLGAQPAMFGLDRSPVVGFIQIAVFLVGLAIICLGGYISLIALWKKATPSIAADFGSRFVATGYVVAVFSGMSDVFGFGSHALPKVPYFGTLQAGGVMVGEGVIAIGFILLIPHFRKSQTNLKKNNSG